MDIRISFARHSPCNPPVQSGLLYHYKGFVVPVQEVGFVVFVHAKYHYKGFVVPVQGALHWGMRLVVVLLHLVGIHKKHNEVVLTFNTPVKWEECRTSQLTGL